MPPKNKTELTHRTTLRLSHALHESLQKARRYHGNTLNAEIIARLEASVTVDRFDQIERELVVIKEMLTDAIKK